jgi:hypothetical protein
MVPGHKGSGKPRRSGNTMTNDQRKRELKDAYKEIVVNYGAYRLRNDKDGTVFIGTYTNMKNGELRLRMQLDDGRHPCAALQAAYSQLGGDAFAYEELVLKDAAKVTDPKWECKHLLEYYLELETSPTYNRDPGEARGL